MLKLKLIQALMRFILEQTLNGNLRNMKWSLQGFGMLRLYLPGDIRVNIWDNRYQVPGVSLIHNHPWDFQSLIVSGKLINVRFIQLGTEERSSENLTRQLGPRMLYNVADIVPGEGGGLMTETQSTIALRAAPGEFYCPGDSYYQSAREIHQTTPDTGTITINIRTNRNPVDRCLTLWPKDKEWVSALPRPAEDYEVKDICTKALEKMNA